MLFEQILPSGATLHPGDSVISPNKQYAMTLQNNGNLVHVFLGPPQQVIWASNTSGHRGNSCKMQQDGNLVVYSSSNHALWASHTRGNRNTHLSVNDDGSAYIIASSGQKVGASFLEHLILWTDVSSTPSEEGDSPPSGGK